MRNSAFVFMIFAAMSLGYGQPADISAANSAHYVGGKSWAWTVYLLADPNTLTQIQCVEYHLHPTFPNPVRTVCDKGGDDQPFALSTRGWGMFTLHIKVLFFKGSPKEFDYDLKLVETGCAKPIDAFMLAEKQFHALAKVTPPAYLYAEEVHAKDKNSHFRVFRPIKALPLGQNGFPKDLKRVQSRSGATLEPGSYIPFDLSPGQGPAEIAVPISASQSIGLAVANPSSHSTVEVKVCP